MDSAERGESRDCGDGALQVSGNAGIAADARGSTSAVSVRAGIFKFSRDSGIAGCAWQAAADAGSNVLRWPGIRASAADGAGYAFGNRAGPANDWMRKEHFDRQT